MLPVVHVLTEWLDKCRDGGSKSSAMLRLLIDIALNVGRRRDMHRKWRKTVVACSLPRIAVSASSPFGLCVLICCVCCTMGLALDVSVFDWFCNN